MKLFNIFTGKGTNSLSLSDERMRKKIYFDFIKEANQEKQKAQNAYTAQLQTKNYRNLFSVNSIADGLILLEKGRKIASNRIMEKYKLNAEDFATLVKEGEEKGWKK